MLPAIKLMDKDLLLIIVCLVLYLFLFIEIIRNKIKNNYFLDIVSDYLTNNIDERDNKNFILTHCFLFTGVISSFILNELINIKYFDMKNDISKENYFISEINNNNEKIVHIKYLIGLVSLGIGDSFVIIFISITYI